jgi:GeoRSP system PqqD family protein
MQSERGDAVRPKRNPEVVWRLEQGLHTMAWDKARKGEDYEDLGVLTLMAKGSIHQLNLVGAEIWTRINGVNTVEKIAAEIAALFDADPAEIDEDVRAFLEDSETKGWVTRAEGAGPGRRWTPR